MVQESASVARENVEIQCIGHSLGAHSCGMAGKLFQLQRNGKPLDKIVALDPAGPFFDAVHGHRDAHGLLSTKNKWRIQPTDAAFVHGIHTDIEGLVTSLHFGSRIPVGHLDVCE